MKRTCFCRLLAFSLLTIIVAQTVIASDSGPFYVPAALDNGNFYVPISAKNLTQFPEADYPLPTINYWQDASMDGGMVLLQQILKNGDAGTILALALIATVFEEMNWDVYSIRVKFSNSNYQNISVSPEQFRVSSGKYGQSYPLSFFLVSRNRGVEHWESVSMPSGSAIELYGFYFAQKGFKGAYLNVGSR